ncbi:hypothetical protein CHUAL_007503 [Chamberlinius hualienensis]
MINRVVSHVRTVSKAILSDKGRIRWLVNSSTVALHLRRMCSTNPDTVLYSQTIDANKCRKLSIKTREHSVNIMPVDTLDKVINLNIIGREITDESMLALTSASNFGVSVTKNDDHVLIDCERTEYDKNIQLNVQIPYIPSLDLHCFHDSGLRMSLLECRNVSVNMENGSFTSYNIKCHCISAYSRNGSIIADGYIMGNAYLRTDNHGNIVVKRMQGNEIKMKCTGGNIKVGALYAENSRILGQNANATLSNVHGDCDIFIESGNLSLTGFDGQLRASVSRGDAKIQIEKVKHPSHSEIMVHKGDVDLSLSPELKLSLRLEGKDIIMDENVNSVGQFLSGTKECVIYEGSLNGGELLLHPHIVCASHGGKLHFALQNWFSNFKNR